MLTSKARYPVNPPPPIIAPTAAVVAKTPFIPKEVIIANQLPATTLPIPDCIPAAIELAPIPMVPNPANIGNPPPNSIVPPVIATPIQIFLNRN